MLRGASQCPGTRSVLRCAGGSPAWTALSLLPLWLRAPPAGRLLPHLLVPAHNATFLTDTVMVPVVCKAQALKAKYATLTMQCPNQQ